MLNNNKDNITNLQNIIDNNKTLENNQLINYVKNRKVRKYNVINSSSLILNNIEIISRTNYGYN